MVGNCAAHEPSEADVQTLPGALSQHPHTEQTRELQFLVENRRGLVDDKTYFSNRLIAQLKLYYRQILRWFYKPASPVACDFLLRWPTLEAAQKATPRALKTFFRNTSVRMWSAASKRFGKPFAPRTIRP
jgi:hypothetical protein